MQEPRHDWSIPEIESIYSAPLLDLLLRAQLVHREHHHPNEVQGCVLLNVKSGGCPEDCAYCPQSAHYRTEAGRYDLMQVDEALAAARRARDQGATRFCMGAAWRDAAEGEEFDRVLAMVRGVRALGMEACCTLGMLSDSQARRLNGSAHPAPLLASQHRCWRACFRRVPTPRRAGTRSAPLLPGLPRGTPPS